MRVLVCGSRDWDDEFIVNVVLGGFYGQMKDDWTIIHGAARGADALADKFGREMFVGRDPYPADWENRPRWVAGPERNQRMLDEGKPDIVIAFKDDFNWDLDHGGTEDMVKRASEAGVPTYVISRA